MTDIIRKVLDCEIKKVGEREYEFTASTATQDRDGDVIDPAGWDLKNFKKNPVIMYGHDYRSLPIGKAPRVWISNGTLKNTVQFPPEGTYEFADIVERLVDTGYLKTESVGFIPRKWEDGDGEKAPRRKFTKQELLEISIVPIPSNPDALREAMEKGVITEEQLDIVNETEYLAPQALTEMLFDKIVTKPEETDEYIRIPVRDCNVTATIDISEKEGIKALYCGKEKKVRTYLFRKDKGWTMAKAKKWVSDHEKGKEVDERVITATDNNNFVYVDIDDTSDGTVSIPYIQEVPQPKDVSQEQITDELDYLIEICKEHDFNEDNKELAKNLIEELTRLTGSDIPDDIDIFSPENRNNLIQSVKEGTKILLRKVK